MTIIKVINIINNNTSLRKQPRWIYSCRLGGKCLEKYRRPSHTMPTIQFYSATWEVFEECLSKRLKTLTETSTHPTDTPKGYHLLTLLTNRRKLKW